LNKAVGKIRHALGDLAESPRYVETLERRGYRFIAVVERAAARLPRADPRMAAGRVLRLVWVDRTIPLPDGPNLIGRDLAAFIWIDSSDVSRRHARIVVTEGCALLEDLGSKNGTFLNGHRLGSPATLHDGDSIRIGPALLAFRSAPPLDVTRTAVV